LTSSINNDRGGPLLPPIATAGTALRIRPCSFRCCWRATSSRSISLGSSRPIAAGACPNCAASGGVEEATRCAGCGPAELVVSPSPYRSLVGHLLKCVTEVHANWRPCSLIRRVSEANRWAEGCGADDEWIDPRNLSVMIRGRLRARWARFAGNQVPRPALSSESGRMKRGSGRDGERKQCRA
jgi:hypothetical protein